MTTGLKMQWAYSEESKLGRKKVNELYSAGINKCIRAHYSPGRGDRMGLWGPQP